MTDTEPYIRSTSEALADEYEAGLRGMEAAGDEEDFTQLIHEHKLVIAALRAPAQFGVLTEQAPLDWLAERKNCELSFSGYDEDPAWLVHFVNGGRNDREWTLLATGDTPEKALRKAMSLALSSATRGGDENFEAPGGTP